MSKIVLYEDAACHTYPERGGANYSPNDRYPEYPWPEEIAAKENRVYDSIRNVFILAGLDAEHSGEKGWNPLGEYITPGDTVLLKPNWVENKNKRHIDDSLQSLVTNPAVVRAVLDYVWIALKGTGKVYIGDAPMQGCDIENLFEVAGYRELFQFYRDRGIDLRVADLRKYSVQDKYNGVFTEPHMNEDTFGGIVVDIGPRSLHYEKESLNPRYKVEDYPQTLTQEYHSNGHHRYEVNRLPLMADVIINLPKPKTHRLAGFTGACKNFVGITYEKASLPHRADDDRESGKGDAYSRHSAIKGWMRYFNEKRTYHSREGNYVRCKCNDFLMKASYVIGSALSGDWYRIGSWYGNDTIWRTAMDLNRIILYADKHGNLQSTAQRRIIHIGDMVISGEKEGPVAPTPKPLGIILFSDNAMAFDRTLCGIMGFRSECFPMFSNKNALGIFSFVDKDELDRETLISNRKDIDGVELSQFPLIDEWKFEPHPTWKGHIEKG